MNDSTNPNNQQVVSNPATQTLFRFVSLRNPQLAKRDGNTKFIFRKEGVKGAFDGLLSNGWAQSAKSKIDYLTEKVKADGFDFTDIYRNEAQLNEHFSNLYSYSKILLKNDFLTETEVRAIDITVDVTSLWDSLIYQVLVQEDFYIKELITQMLQTLHYAENYTSFSTETNAKKKLAKQNEVVTAKVVLPESLFIDSAPVDNQVTAFTVEHSAVGSNDPISGDGSQNINVSGNNVTKYLPTESVLKRQKVAVAVYEKEQLESLKKELVKTQTLYNKQYTKAYDLAAKDYQNLIKPIYDAYEHQLLQVEATFTEEMTEASKKLALSQVAKPALPDFEFEFRAERDVAFLQNKLSKTSLESFVSLIGEYASPETVAGRLNNDDVLQENIVEIGEDQYVLPADENLNFGEMLETINSRLSELNDEIYQNTEVEKQEYVSVGGVLIPVDNHLTTNKTESKYFNVATIFNANTWSVMLTFEDRSISIVNASYSAKLSNASIDDGSFVQSASGVYKLFNGTQVLPINNFKNGFLLDVEFTLSDGKKYTAVCTLVHFSSNTDTSINGYLTGGTSLNLKSTSTEGGGGTGGTDTGGGNQDTPGTPITTNNSFIPKGFGIKRLGIADYLKVEQSTHAYVEGEVAAIENIMAREYREKSTRRLRRSEVTETTSSDTEREQLTDTTTASRFEMQSEVAKILQETTNLEAHTSFSYGPDKMRFEIGGSYANSRNKEDSMTQAVTQAQDVTARALDRVVTKVHQERIEKIIEEFEENNSHGFDNRKGDKHVVGVYRWVDKLMKNQVWDYGKRLMFEFAIPQPAKLHLLATESLINKKIIEKPADPRISTEFKMSDYTALASENVLKHWQSIYYVEIDTKPSATLLISKSFNGRDPNFIGEDGKKTQIVVGSDELIIPEGYIVTSADYCFVTYPHGFQGYHQGNMTIGGVSSTWITGTDTTGVTGKITSLNVEDKLAFSYFTGESPIISGSIKAYSSAKESYINEWQQKTFNAIIQAYEDAMTEYNNKVAEEETKANNIKGSNPLFYRQIEQEVLKHNCIAYLTDDKSRTKNIGTQMYTGNQLLDFKVNRTDIDEYTSFAKFMEQAFEWDIMSYNLYPYYWGNKGEWGSMYVLEDADPLFRSFLRSGMARVVVTVRPGFEDAVQFYMATGRLWNGGQVPVIGDPMYLSIVDELKDIKGETQGKAWITRIPTSLTILQAQNIGLEVQHALPFTTEDPLDFENPEEVITKSNFYPSDDQMEAEKSKLVENIEINNDYLQLTNNDNPHQVIAQLSLEDLKEALE